MRDARPLAVCGLVLLASLVLASRLNPRLDTEAFLLWLCVGSVAYVGALVLVARRITGTSRALLLCVALSVVWRIALMAGAPLVSDDVYRYVWDGRVQRHGYNPYLSAPDDPALANLHTEVTRRIDPTSAVLPTIYPPAAQLFFRTVSAVHESVSAFVLAVLVCDLLIIAVLWRWLVSMDRSPWWVLAYAWHPLIAIEGAGGAHVDFVGTLLVVSAAYALNQGRGLLASTALGLAFSIKFLPLVLLPLLWRRVQAWHAATAVAIVLALYLPFLRGTSGLPIGSLGTYAAQWRFNGPVFAWLESGLGLSVGVVAAVTSGLVVGVVARRRLSRQAPEAWAWPMATTVFFMPAVYPWYLVWVVPFLTVRATWPLVAWSLAVLLTYAVWISETAGAGWVLPDWVLPVEFGCVAVGAVAAWLAIRRAPAGSNVR